LTQLIQISSIENSCSGLAGQGGVLECVADKLFPLMRRERAFERFLLSDIPTVCHFNNKEAKASERLPAGRQEARMSESAFSRLLV
jgi:hypothetical protein